MNRKIIGGIAVSMLAAIAALNVNLGLNKESKTSFLTLANIEALAQGETPPTTPSTWQVGTKVTVTTTEPGWTYDVGGNFWLFHGKRTSSSPASTSTVTIKCCRSMGDVTQCPYEPC